MNDFGKIQLTDPGFQPQHSGKCDLLLKISPFRFSYAVIDQGQDQIKVLFDDAVTDGLSDLQQIFQNELLFNSHFHKVKVLFETSSFTLIPASLYNEANLTDYAQFIEGAISDLIVSDIRGAQVKSIFAAGEELRNMLRGKFSGYKITSSAAPLIDAVMKFYGGNGKQLFLNFNTDSFEAVVLQDKKLQFYNIFQIETADDFNYFLLLLLEKLAINPQDMDLVISGEIEMLDENYLRMQKYFQNIRFADCRQLVNQSNFIEQVSPHRFFSLIALSLCE